MAKRVTMKIYPEEAFFVVPGKGPTIPLWKQQELARDPSFRDLKETIKDMAQRGSGSTWSSKHGYETTFREEAAMLKANGREERAKEKKVIEAIQKTRQPPLASTDSCCAIC